MARMPTLSAGRAARRRLPPVALWRPGLDECSELPPHDVVWQCAPGLGLDSLLLASSHPFETESARALPARRVSVDGGLTKPAVRPPVDPAVQ